MNLTFGQTPFLRLLIPVFAGILFNRYFPGASNAFVLCLGGALGMVLSSVLPQNKRFSFRWLFGAGLALFLFGFTITSYRYRTQLSAFAFPIEETDYAAVVTDIPQKKPRSVACNVNVFYPVKKKAIVYFQQTDESFRLAAGDKIVFRATFQPFRNLGNPDDFDYVRFMQMKGFSGSAYVSSNRWMLMNGKGASPFIFAQRMRTMILAFFRSFDLQPDQFAFLSAVTVGYKSSLSNDIREAFNASGTSHILAVSGYHVGVIYLILTSLLGFMNGSRKRRATKQIVIITVLWVYAFITGLPVSVIRSAIMLTIFCVGNIYGRSGFTYNTLAATAFMILIFNPYHFFDLGFQLSFASAFSILYFLPKFNRVLKLKNKYVRYVWQLMAVSLAAQIGVSPLILYYFGMFPSYFLFANVLVVPLVGVIMYAFLPFLAFALLKQIRFAVFDLLYDISKWVVEFLVGLVLKIVYFIEALPYSQLTGNYISAFQALVIFAFLFTSIRFLQNKSGRTLIASLSFVCIFLLTFSDLPHTEKTTRWMVFNKPGFTEIGIYRKGKRMVYITEENGFVPHPTKRILRISENKYDDAPYKNGLSVDVLILSHDTSFSLHKLQQLFHPGIIVLDSSLPLWAASRMSYEGSQLKIKTHDVSRMGAFSMDF